MLSAAAAVSLTFFQFLCVTTYVISSAICDSLPYDERLSRQLANFSMMSYCTYEKLQIFGCGVPCAENPSAFKFAKKFVSKSAVILGYSPDLDAIVISFKGTTKTSLSDHITNFFITKSSYSECAAFNDCKVHSGFLSASTKLLQQFLSYFQLLKKHFYYSKVYVTGFSQGAANAILSIPEIYHMNDNKRLDGVYVFGAPKVGDIAYCDWFNENIDNLTHAFFRVVNQKDVITTVPSTYKQHAGKEVFYEEDIEGDGKLVPHLCEGSFEECTAEKLRVSNKSFNFNSHLHYFNWDWATILDECESKYY